MRKTLELLLPLADYRALTLTQRIFFAGLVICTLAAANTLSNVLGGSGHSIRTVLIRTAVSFSAGGILSYMLRMMAATKNNSEPPRNGRFLIMLFMANPSGDALLGDLEERFSRIANDPTQGPGRAHFWYWFQVAISLRPLAWAGLKRLSGLAALYKAIR